LALGEHVEKTPGQKRVEDTVRTLWSRVSLGGALVLIEPGTPRGSELIRRARAQVLDIERAAADKRARAGKADGGGDDSVSLVSSSAGMEAHVVAPCQHDRTCPMDGLNSWCHFSQRVVRSAMHRQMLPRGRGPQHQDERFSYVVIRRLSREGATAEATARATRIASGGGDYFGDEDGERDADRDGEAEGSTFRDEDDDEEEREERRRIRMSIRGSDQNRNSAENDEEDEAEAAMQSGEHEGEDGNEDEDEDKDEDNSESLAAAMAVASSHEWGRMVRPPMKKTGHVIIDVCSAEGNLVRHIVAKSSAWEGGVGKSGYKAARKSKWGDLWPYRDPRAVNELDDDDRQLHLEAFFKDFEGVNMDQVDGSGPGVATPAKAQRSTPIGVGGARKPFMKRPKIVEKYVEMERAGQNVEDIEGVG
jgi:ribosomal protein RSM22 (predicted rRNA methylase)